MMRRAKAVVFVGTDVKGKTTQHHPWNHLIQLKKWPNIWKEYIRFFYTMFSMLYSIHQYILPGRRIC